MQCGQSKRDHQAVRTVGVAWLCLSGGECPSQGYPGAVRRLGRMVTREFGNGWGLDSRPLSGSLILGLTRNREEAEGDRKEDIHLGTK